MRSKPNNSKPQPPETITLHAAGTPTRKRRGEAAQAAFLARATSLNSGVLIPWGDSERYDSVVELRPRPLPRPGQIRHRLRRKPLPRQNHWSQRQSLYQQRNRLLRSLHRPRKHLVHHPHSGHRPAQRHPLLSHQPPPVKSHVRKIPRSLVPPRFLPECPPKKRPPPPLPQQENGSPLRHLPPKRLSRGFDASLKRWIGKGAASAVP